MKIKDVEAIKIRFPLDRKIKLREDINIKYRDLVLVKIHTNRGITGIGESQAFPKMYFNQQEKNEGKVTTGIITDLIKDYLGPAIIGKNPLEIGRLWDKMSKRHLFSGRTGLEMYAIAGIDVALWDILGKVVKKPICELLGGYNDKIKAYYSLGDLEENELKTKLEKGIEEGYKAFKIRVGINHEKSIKNIKLTRDILGDNIAIMADANGAFQTHQAKKYIREYREFSLYWLEEPLMPHNLEGYNRLKQYSDIPIALGEHHLSRFEFKKLLSSGIGDIFQPDIRIGGITECRKISEMADSWGIPIAPHNFDNALRSAATLQLLGGISNSLFFEKPAEENPLQTELLVNPIEIKDGLAKIPKKPGLGVKLNEDIVSKYKVNC